MQKKFTNLDYLTLNVFTTLSELKSGVATANKLNISQPKVTRSINLLRQTFDNELFSKESNGMFPNDFAILIYPKIKAILEEFEGLSNTIYTDKMIKVVHIAIQSHFKELMLKVIAEASKEFGDTYSFRFHTWSDATQKKLLTGEIDYSIAINPPSAVEIKVQEILPIKQFLLVARSEHPALKHDFILSDYLSYPMVLFNFSQKDLKKHRIEYHAESLALKCNIAMKSNDMDMAFDYIEKTNAIGWFAGSMVQDKVNKYPSLQCLDVSSYWEENIIPYSKIDEPVYYLQSNYSAPSKLTCLIFNTLKKELKKIENNNLLSVNRQP